jgi:hypothetical protein
MDLSPQMTAYIEQNIPKKFSDRNKVRVILRAMIKSNYLNMQYDVDKTLNRA